MAPCTEQHGHMSKHADCAERNWGNALCVQHVCIVPAIWVPEDVSRLCAVASVRRQSRNNYKLNLEIYTTSFPLRCIIVPLINLLQLDSLETVHRPVIYSSYLSTTVYTTAFFHWLATLQQEKRYKIYINNVKLSQK